MDQFLGELDILTAAMWPEDEVIQVADETLQVTQQKIRSDSAAVRTLMIGH